MLMAKALTAVVLIATALVFQDCSVPLPSQANSQNMSTRGTASSAGVANSGTSTDNPVVAVQMSFGKFNSSASVALCISGSQFNTQPLLDLVTNFQYNGNLSEYMQNVAALEQNVVTLEQNMMNSLFVPQLNPSGTTLGQQMVSSGTYEAVTLSLAPGCNSGASLVLQNANGTFNYTQPIALTFEGQIAVSSSSTNNVTLDLSGIADALANVTSADQIASILNSTQGSLTITQ